MSSEEAAMKYLIVEYEGFSHKLIKRRHYDTLEEAIFEYKQLRLGNLFSGVVGKYKHYYSYPELVKTGVKPKSKNHLWSNRAQKLSQEIKN